MVLSAKEKWAQKDWLLLRSSQPERIGDTMGKSYNRRFRKNGLSFMVQDTHPADRRSDTDKYYLTINRDGIYKIVYYNTTWEIPKFPTIHAAQFWALTSSDFIGTI